MSEYKWGTPLEWLKHKVYGYWNVPQIQATVMQLAEKVDIDGLTDIFQDEMERDGYFVPLEEEA